MLKIRDLYVRVADKEILKGINLTVNPGEVHAIMGPNGSGKSTLAKVIVGHPAFNIVSGNIIYEGESILGKSPEEIAHKGIFMAFQYPVEIPGVNNANFLRLAYNAKRQFEGKDELDPLEFDDLLREKLKLIDMDPGFINRSVNEGFSGGEKKKNEILQMAILEPKLGILDETDSGLDIDALREVTSGLNSLMASDKAIILVTHYQRILNYINPHTVHVLSNGRIVKSGGRELALILEERGYDWITESEEIKV